MDQIISDCRKTARSRAAWKMERRRARERMRYVEPHNAGKILAHHRYWTVQFLELYLERCDETAFDLPSDAYLLAQHAPEMARRIRVGDRAGEFLSPLEKLSGIVLALAVKGSCCRAQGEFAEAELCFQRAFSGLRDRKPLPVAMAELHRRYAALLFMSGSSDAEVQIERSLSFSEQAAFLPCSADAFALRGLIRYETHPAEAIQDLIEATRLADLKSPRGKRTAQASLQNIGSIIAYRSVGLRDQEAALRLLNRLKEELKGTPTSSRKLKVLWLEGLLLGNLRIERHSKRQLRKARLGLLALDDLASFLVVSIDLYRLLLVFGDDEEASHLIDETAELMAQAGPDPLLLDLLNRWVEEKPAAEGVREFRDLALALER